MNKLIRRLLSFAAIMPFAITGSAMASTSDDLSSVEVQWEQAVAQNTLEGYAVFALNHPTSTFAREARARLAGGTTPALDRAKIDGSPGGGADGRNSVPEFISEKMMVV